MRVGKVLGPLAALVGGFALGHSTGTSAQQMQITQLDPNAPPVLGTRRISPQSTFGDESFMVASGGPLPVANTPGGCAGHVTTYPTIVFEATAPFPHFQLTVESDGDTTLLVQAPDGSYSCNDDTFSTDPSITLAAAQAGTYRVWVGSYSAGTMHNGTLRVSSQPYTPPGHAQVQPQPPPTPRGTLDPNLPPRSGSVTVVRRVPRDPARIQLTSGGAEMVDRNAYPGCLGWASREPTYNIDLQQARSYMQLWVRSAGADTTLIVRHPDGTFTCNDDCENLEPMVELIDPQPGVYSVWVGSYHQNQSHPSTLHISGRRSNKRRPQC